MGLRGAQDLHHALELLEVQHVVSVKVEPANRTGAKLVGDTYTLSTCLGARVCPVSWSDEQHLLLLNERRQLVTNNVPRLMLCSVTTAIDVPTRFPIGPCLCSVYG